MEHDRRTRQAGKATENSPTQRKPAQAPPATQAREDEGATRVCVAVAKVTAARWFYSNKRRPEPAPKAVPSTWNG